MEVWKEQQRARESLDEGHGSAMRVVDAAGASLRTKPSEDGADEDPAYVGEDVMARPEQTDQGKGRRQDPLAERRVRQNVVGKESRGLMHTACGARWAECAALA